MGDTGDQAEAVDEKMWLGDEEDDGARPEDRKDADTVEEAGEEEGDARTRKTIAGQQSEDDEPEHSDGGVEMGKEATKVGPCTTLDCCVVLPLAAVMT